MSLANIEFYSQAMGQQVSFSLYMPETGSGPFPVVMQLHGLSDSHQSWVERSNIARHATPYEMMIAFPNGGTGCYLDWLGHERIGKRNYESLIITDITDHLKRNFNVTDGPWGIGGLSMGGYGSMRLGLKYPDRFASIWSHSSKLEWEGLAESGFFADPNDVSVHWHAENIGAGQNGQVISFDCGVDDEGLIDENRRFHQHLEKLGIPHTFNEHPGGHEWDYWDAHVPAALAQHARVLGVNVNR